MDRLDSPPSSRFRRPWSPDPFDPLPSAPRYPQREPYSGPRRDPSDVSVDALDLADYAAVLNRDHLYHHSPFRAYDDYPPSPQSHRPFASPDSPPVLSLSASSSPSPSDSASYAPLRRPFSLSPPPSLPLRSLQSHPSYPHAPSELHVHVPASPSEADLAQFPPFSRDWYEVDRSKQPLSPPMSAYGHDGLSAHKLSPFDPAFPAHAYNTSPYALSPPPSYPSRSSRDLNTVPWSVDPADADLPIDPALKEERIRMLEAEFGTKQAPQDEGEKVGSVDANGNLITDGPRKRLAVRCIEILLALTASAASIYTALIIKPPSAPPPESKLPAYLLYVLSFLTVLSMIYLFMIYPCCCGRRKVAHNTPFAEGPGGMMVLPVQSLPGGGKKTKSKKMKGGGGGDGVQVNLIVDPTMFGGGDRERDEWGEDADDGDTDLGPPGSFAASERQRRRPRRRGIFAGLAMEAQWTHARKQLKMRMAYDIVACLLWGAVFVVILMGQRCPVGGYDGWCDGYNVGTAAACLLCLAFGFSIFFDIKDVYASKASPRTRPL